LRGGRRTAEQQPDRQEEKKNLFHFQEV